jgi:diguanylate cyclase (GGDEF)-like protein
MRSQNAAITAMTGHTDVQRIVQPDEPIALPNRALELTSLLQTTLDLDQLIDLFAERIRHWLEMDGLRYCNVDQGIEIESGRSGGNLASYQLVIEDKQLGSIELYRPHPFSEVELMDLEKLLCALVYPLRNALSYRRALERALRDPLTGVQNRAALTAAVEREVERSRRHDLPLAMLVCDIDHFKHINDNHGHSFGDDVLKAVAHTAEATIRKSDQLFRFGGEEFVILASHTGEDGARQLAERIRRAIEAIDSINGRDICITASLGVALMPPGKTSEALFDRADQALYDAKQGGRNRTVIAK